MVHEREPPAKSSLPQFSLRRTDQAVTACLAAAAAAILIGHWFVNGRFQGRVIEIERATPRQIAFQVDLNEAEWSELTLLPGVGEQLAKRIVAHREEFGPFGDLNDLRRVRGIGPKTFERVQPYLMPLPDRGNVAGTPPGRSDG